MGRITKLRDLIGVIKDKASVSRAALLSKPNTLSLHLAVLRSTTHSPPSTPPDEKRLSALLSLGDSSRATASALVESLMDRLHRTRDSSVALKCLLTIHHIVNRGPFILQDQLSVFPAAGGHNYLKLSAFHDGATAATMALSIWVRWYARYLETLLSTSRVLGFFLSSSSSSNLERENQGERVSSFTNVDLIRDVDSLVGLIEEICKVPDSLLDDGNKLLCVVVGLVAGDYSSAVNEVLTRLGEFRERLNCLSFGESVELVCILKRLEVCRERLMGLFTIKKASTETLWGLTAELKGKIEKIYGDGEKLVNVGRRETASESARFGDRVMSSGDSVTFSSARFDINKFSFVIKDSLQFTS